MHFNAPSSQFPSDNGINYQQTVILRIGTKYLRTNFTKFIMALAFTNIYAP